MKSITGTVLGAILVAGCATPGNPPISLVIEKIGTEGVSRVDDGDREVRSAVNISGIAQPVSTGAFLSVPRDNLPELYSSPVTAACSRIVETRYNSDANDADVRAIGAGLSDYQDQLVNRAAANIQLQLASAMRVRAGNVLAAEEKLDADADLIRMAGLAGVAAPLTIETIDAALTKAKEAVAAADTAVKEANTKITTLNNQRNILITRWASNDNRSRATKIGAIFRLAAQAAEKRSGYLVLADIRTSSLEFGADAAEFFANQKGTSDGSFSLVDGSFLVGYTMGARHHYFLEDRDYSRLLQSRLSLSAAELTSIFGGEFTSFIQGQSLQIENALASAVSGSSRGAMSEPVRTVYPYRMGRTFTMSRSADAERKRNQNFATIYSIRSNIKGSSLKARPDWVRYHCDHTVPKKGPMALVNLQKVGYEFCLPSTEYSEQGQCSKLNRQSRENGKDGSPLCLIPDKERCIPLDQSISDL